MIASELYEGYLEWLVASAEATKVEIEMIEAGKGTLERDQALWDLFVTRRKQVRLTDGIDRDLVESYADIAAGSP